LVHGCVCVWGGGGEGEWNECSHYQKPNYMVSWYHVITSRKTGLLIVLTVSCAEVAFGDHRFQSDITNRRKHRASVSVGRECRHTLVWYVFPCYGLDHTFRFSTGRQVPIIAAQAQLVQLWGRVLSVRTRVLFPKVRHKIGKCVRIM
jgi:hypothetical protein